MSDLALIAFGLLAGFIDSIAGGGGVITVPVMSLALGAGSLAIGTNKVASSLAALAALVVYARAGHVSLRGSRKFAFIVAAGSVAGAMVSPFVPPFVYRWLIVAICPAILIVVFRKDLWIRQETGHHFVSKSEKTAPRLLLLVGLAIGFYDGVAGPGGGTLMFLSLFLIVRLPLLIAMATAKVANLASALVALGSYASQGNVAWKTGLTLGLGVTVGALLGAMTATAQAARVARIALAVVALLLIIRLALF